MIKLKAAAGRDTAAEWTVRTCVVGEKPRAEERMRAIECVRPVSDQAVI